MGCYGLTEIKTDKKANWCWGLTEDRNRLGSMSLKGMLRADIWQKTRRTKTDCGPCRLMGRWRLTKNKTDKNRLRAVSLNGMLKANKKQDRQKQTAGHVAKKGRYRLTKTDRSLTLLKGVVRAHKNTSLDHADKTQRCSELTQTRLSDFGVLC